MGYPGTEKKQEPQYKVVVKTADIDPADREIRINRALDILIDEALRERGQKRRTA